MPRFRAGQAPGDAITAPVPFLKFNGTTGWLRNAETSTRFIGFSYKGISNHDIPQPIDQQNTSIPKGWLLTCWIANAIIFDRILLAFSRWELNTYISGKKDMAMLMVISLKTAMYIRIAIIRQPPSPSEVSSSTKLHPITTLAGFWGFRFHGLSASSQW